jgi:hypothetical protein
MSFPLDFDGRSFANRRRLAKYLAPVSGLSITSCIELMKRHENDPATAIAQLQSPSPLHYDGRSFRRPTDLARYLTTIVGGKRSVEAVRVMLRCKGHDPAAVVAHYRAIDTRFFARVGSQIYRTKKDFIRYVNRYYGIPAGTVTAWLNAGEPIADVLSAAKEHRTTTPAASYWQGPVVLFGWRFASFTALCRYYGRSPTSWNHKWREHAAGGGTAARFSPLLVAITRLWQWSVLDERNRRYDESDIPPRWRPQNAIPEEIIDEFEKKLVDALQPSEVDTIRRAALRELERRRSRGAQS